MEALALYLFRSSVWLTGFALVYALFLRNERFFTLNRIYLVSGILVSFIFPLFTWHYTVLLPLVPVVEGSEPQIQGIVVPEQSFNPQNLLLVGYLAGILFLVFRILKQTLPIFSIIKKSETYSYRSAKLIRTDAYPASFSFFSFIFVNPSIDEIETNEIVNHELEHIRQQHWIDLLLFEILRTMQWFNPVIWLYGHLIRQNHEYLADEHALQRSSNPAIYRAALLNQMFGGPVISLANSFNYSLNKKRFDMMKHNIKSPLRKLKLLLVLPLMAGVFYAFATPEYKFQQAKEKSGQDEGLTIQDAKTHSNGQNKDQASLKDSVTTLKGNFVSLSSKGTASVSGLNFNAKNVQGKSKNGTNIIKADTISVDFAKSNSLFIIDGKEATKAEVDQLNPDKIESVNVLKGESAITKYGVKSKNGVVEISLKKVAVKEEDSKSTLPPTIYLQTNSPLKFGISDDSGKQPLIVKDGVIVEGMNVNNIPPETIESINVLKGEQATKIYGNKGINGVILITSKKGTSTTSNSTIDVKVTADVNDKKANSSKIGNITWVNNTIYSSAKLNEVLGMKKGDEYSKEKLNSRIWNDKRGVSSLYLDKGYLFSNIKTSENTSNDGTINLIFTIYEGNRGKIGKIDIKGNKNVPTKDILNKIEIKSGDIFSKAKLIQSVRAIGLMGKFNEVEIKPEIIPGSKIPNSEFINVDLVFNVAEK